MQTLNTKIDFFGKILNLNIFNYDFYKNKLSDKYKGCEGLDIISKCLLIDKCWEPFQTELIYEI